MIDEMDELYGSNDEIEMLLSYSRLSDYDRRGAKTLINRTRVESNAVFMGALVDDLLLDKESFKTKYFIFNGKKPTATLGKLADIIINNYNKLPSKSNILNLISANSLWKGIKNEDILIGYITSKEFTSYIKAQYKSKTQTLLTTEQLAKGQEIADILLTHEYSKDILINNLENHNQFKFNFKYKGIKFRGIIDKLLIDHKNKTIQIIDLKTGQGGVLEFPTSYLKWRYYLQEALYQKSVSYIEKKLKLKGYTLLPFKFLYISTYEKIPSVYVIDNKWHEAALKGFKTTSGWVYKGLDELIDEVKWHYKNNVFHLPREVYENNGLIRLNDEYIDINK